MNVVVMLVCLLCVQLLLSGALYSSLKVTDYFGVFNVVNIPTSSERERERKKRKKERAKERKKEIIPF